MWLKPCCANSIITIIAEKPFSFFIFMNFTSFYPSGGLELDSTFHLDYMSMQVCVNHIILRLLVKTLWCNLFSRYTTVISSRFFFFLPNLHLYLHLLKKSVVIYERNLNINILYVSSFVLQHQLRQTASRAMLTSQKMVHKVKHLKENKTQTNKTK